MTAYDGRVGAWIAGWQCLQSIDKLARDIDKHASEAAKKRVEPDASGIRRQENAIRLLENVATVYAQLAQATSEVGFSAGALLKDDEDRRIRQAETAAEHFADMTKRAGHMTKMTKTEGGGHEAS